MTAPQMTASVPGLPERTVGEQGDRPIFIGGLSHSGKTPLRLMLAELTPVAFTRRTYMWRLFYNRYGDLGSQGNLDRCLAAMLDHPPIAALQPDTARIRQEFSQGPATYARLFALFHRQNALRCGVRRWGDQMGMVEQFADPIFAAYPDARMIHMVRDPRTRYATVAGRNRVRQGKVGIETARWLESIRLGEANQQRYPARYRIVRYESLLDRPEETLRSLCHFLDEEFDPARFTRDGSDAGGEDRDSASHSPFGAGWTEAGDAPALQRQLSPGTLHFIQQATGRHLRRLEYPAPSVQVYGWARVHYQFIEWPVNRLAMTLRPLLTLT